MGKSRDNVVGTVTTEELSASPGRFKNVYFSMSCRPALEILRALSSEAKRPEREALHISLTSAEVKKMSIHPLLHSFSWCCA
jgi:hypothetical protein